MKSMIEMRPGVFRLCRGMRLSVLVVGVLSLPLLAAAQDSAQLFGEHGMSPLAVRQGILGTCFFHASIAEVAKVAPETLKGDILPNPGGGYRVHFSQGPEEIVFPEDVEYGRTHSYDRSEGTWVLVLMRGYAQRVLRLSLVKAINGSTLIPFFVKPLALSWLDQSGPLLVAYDRAIRSVVKQDGELDKAGLKLRLGEQLSAIGIPSEQAAELAGFLDEKGFFDAVALTVRQNGEVFGAYKTLGQGQIPVRVIEAFMGNADAGLVSDHKGVLEQLRRLHAGGVALVAGTKLSVPDPAFETVNKSWWVPSHAYSVLDYDEAAATVTLRNPWGGRPGPDGIFTLPLGVFFQGYEGYSYSR
jgi:hypothetical protein